MAEYKTPGIYVEEITNLPPSAGQVPTAIPAFVGYTEKANRAGKSVLGIPTSIGSLLDFQNIFGGGYVPEQVRVRLGQGGDIAEVEFARRYFLFDSLRMFFANGGGQCFVVSAGLYGQEIEFEALSAALAKARAEELPTLLVCPDAVLLPQADDCYRLQQEMLAQAAQTQDRFAVLDIYGGYEQASASERVAEFRNGLGVSNLQYGAAYFPWVQSSYKTDFSFERLRLEDAQGKNLELGDLLADPSAAHGLKEVVADLELLRGFVEKPSGDFFHGSGKDGKAETLAQKAERLVAMSLSLLEFKAENKLRNGVSRNEMQAKTSPGSAFAALLRKLAGLSKAMGWPDLAKEKAFAAYGLEQVPATPALATQDDATRREAAATQQLRGLFEAFAEVLGSLERDIRSVKAHYDKVLFDSQPLYQSIVSEVNKEGSKLPPSGAVAGVYAKVDGERGVWKAPANVSLAACVRPWLKVDNAQQEDLNIDLMGGKSVNAIRSFIGQGNVVWGARTLAGNDNQWKYVSVRRFFNMVEKSLRLATHWAVFEPNNEVTWIRVKALIDNFLTNQWRAGALQGGSPAEAFYVKIGLGSTMTQTDVLEGRMNIEIGMSVVRPAEFIVLRFSQKFESA